MNKLLTLLVCLCSVVLSFAQPPLVVNHIGIDKGLPNGFVLDMEQDAKGFVWVATEVGVARIAGNDVLSLKSFNSKLNDDKMKCLYYDKNEDVMWLGTQQKGITLFDCKHQRISSLTTQNGLAQNTISDITGGTNGIVWIAYFNGEIQYYDTKTGKVHDYIRARKGKTHPVSQIFDDGNGHLYVAHLYDGLTVVDLTTKGIRRYTKGMNGLTSNSVQTIFVDHLKNIWVGTLDGLFLYDPMAENFTAVGMGMGDAGLAGSYVRSINETADGRLLVATDPGGISILKSLSPMNPAMVSVHNIYSGEILSSANIRKIFEDKYGNLWAGNYCTGVDVISDKQSVIYNLSVSIPQLQKEHVYAVCSQNDGSVWLGGEDKLWLVKGNKVVKTVNFNPSGKIKSAIAYIMMLDRKGNLWVGVNDFGAFVYSTQTGKVTEIRETANLDIHAFSEAPSGEVWIGSERGVYIYDKGKVRYLSSCTDSPVYAICRDRTGQWWIGTLGNGLFLLDAMGKEKYHLTEGKELPSSNINQIYSARNGTLWIATYKGLIEVKNPKNFTNMNLYDERQNILDSHIRAIAEDKNGNLWVSTYSGIACFNVSRKIFDNFTDSQSGAIGGFAESSATITPNGMIYFGSPNGVCYLNPQVFSSTREISPLYIVACHDLSLDSDRKAYSICELDDKGRVVLAYNHNTLNLTFTLSDYSQIDEAEYRYQMEGLDGKWIYTYNDDDVVFRNLAPGRYTFKVQARLKNQPWTSAQETSLTIIVNPPFWWAWYAKLLYILLLAVFVYYAFRRYKHKIMHRAQLAMQLKQNRDRQELNEERLRFYTNITHELRTPLTLILGPLDDLSGDTSLPPRIHQRIDMIHESALRLLGLINQILEFRKVETQNKRLSVSKCSLQNIVKEVGLQYKELNQNANVVFNIQVDDNIPLMYIDREVITSVLNNLLSNAVKYTPNGTITLSVVSAARGGKRYADISVADTGYGIGKEAQLHIFDRYYQAKEQHQASGTGIGLSLVKSLVELHEGEVNVDSQLDKGSTFTVSLLIDNVYRNALHKDVGTPPVATAVSVKDNVEETTEMDNKKPTLLVVEDNPDIIEYIASSLDDSFVVLKGKNGREGMNIAIEKVPDIIVSDIMMPEMDGIEMVKILKNDVRTSHIPIILLTAKDSVEDKEEGYDSGADSYLTKPFSVKLLLSRINNLLESRRRLASAITRHMNLPMPGSATDADSSSTQEDVVDELNAVDRKFLEKLTAIVEENIATQDVDMAFVTDKMNMSHSTCYRKVKALTGISPNEFIRKIKLKNSARLILDGEYSITQIAYMTGFNNLSAFRRAFKIEYSVLPSEYADMIRNKNK